MFQASCRLLQLLTLPGGEVGKPPFDASDDLEGLFLPRGGRPAAAELPALELLIPLARV